MTESFSATILGAAHFQTSRFSGRIEMESRSYRVSGEAMNVRVGDYAPGSTSPKKSISRPSPETSSLTKNAVES